MEKQGNVVLTDNGRQMAARIDHTLLKPDASRAQVVAMCEEALRFKFAAVCVLPVWLPVIVECLRGSNSIPCTVAGFPLGATFTEVKAREAALAARNGAREIDMVLAVWAVKSNEYRVAAEDIRAVVDAAGAECQVKVILETCLLSQSEIIAACRIAVDAGAAFVKTSTGLAGGGATVEDIRLMRETVGPHIGVKASGGIRTWEQANALQRAGANRIGTSAGISIVTTAP